MEHPNYPPTGWVAPKKNPRIPDMHTKHTVFMETPLTNPKTIIAQGSR